MLYEHLTIQLGHAVDSEARIYIHAHDDAEIVSIQGRLRGPQCHYARTLAAEHRIEQLTGKRNQKFLAQGLITDPCYWTPPLPFQYELQLELQDASGEKHALKTLIGLSRRGAEGRHLRLERRRSVLRGAQVSLATPDDLSAARLAETALLVDAPHTELCSEASRLGVPLVVDLRGSDTYLAQQQRLTWCPAMLIALLNPEQLRGASRTSSLLAQSISTSTSELEAAAADCDLYAIELSPDESPPAWLATCNKPVLAIRRGESHADLSAARAGCDRLQSDLAPQFDFSGYFVAP